MSLLLLRRHRVFGIAYSAKVLSYSPISLWKMDELTGTNADNAEGTAARDGTYTGVALDSVDGPVAGERSGRWDGANDFCDIRTTGAGSLQTDFSYTQGSVMIWGKVAAAGVWTDSTVRMLVGIYTDSNNFLQLTKSSVDNTLFWNVETQNVKPAISSTAHGSPTGWFCMGVTWTDAGGGVMKAYFDGVQEGADQTGGPSWAGTTLNVNRNNIGCSVKTGPTLVFDGYLAYCSVFPTVLDAAAMLDLATL